MQNNFRKYGLGIALGAAGLVTALAAPGADAAVTGVSVAPGTGGLRVGCPYTVTVNVDAPPLQAGPVSVINSGGHVPGNGEQVGTAVYHPESRTATLRWTPKYAGWQNITGIQFTPGKYTSSRYTMVNVVGQGINAGSSCLPLS
jgi:hypothetical protein